VARKLIGQGYGNVFVLKGGWKAWQKDSLPVEPKAE